MVGPGEGLLLLALVVIVRPGVEVTVTVVGAATWAAAWEAAGAAPAAAFWMEALWARKAARKLEKKGVLEVMFAVGSGAATVGGGGSGESEGERERRWESCMKRVVGAYHSGRWTGTRGEE